MPPKPNAKGKGNWYYFFVVKMTICRTAPVTDFLSQCQTGSSVTDFLLGGESFHKQKSQRCVDEPHYIHFPYRCEHYLQEYKSGGMSKCISSLAIVGAKSM